MNPKRGGLRAFLAFPSLNLWINVEREMGEESFERRWDWDHARHGGRMSLHKEDCQPTRRVTAFRSRSLKPDSVDIRACLFETRSLGPEDSSMSDNGSASSLPTSPVTAVPDSPGKRTRKLAWDNPQRRGPASVVSETTEGNGDYFTPANLPFSFSSASLALSAVPREWSSSKHGFHGAWLSTLVTHRSLPNP